MKLFIRKDNKISIARDEIFLYPEFKPILEKYGKDDSILKKILTYIYFTCDSNALPQQHGYTVKETHAYALKAADLSPKFEVGEDIKLAQKFYRKEHTNHLIEYTENLVKSLRVSNKICKIILDNQDISSDASIEEITKVSEAINKILSISNTVNSSIPKYIENIKELKLLEEEANTIEDGRKLRGGNEIPDSYTMEDELDG